jgi:hypothetical protein
VPLDPPADPAGPLHAAGYFAPLVARGLVGEREAVAALAAAAARAAPGRDRGGMRMRLVHALRDQVAAQGMARALARARLDRALRPLLEGWAAPAALYAAARAASWGAIGEDEIAAEVAARVRARLARG